MIKAHHPMQMIKAVCLTCTCAGYSPLFIRCDLVVCEPSRRNLTAGVLFVLTCLVIQYWQSDYPCSGGVDSADYRLIACTCVCVRLRGWFNTMHCIQNIEGFGFVSAYQHIISEQGVGVYLLLLLYTNQYSIFVTL